MILAWVLSLLLLCSSLITYLERWSVLKVMNVKSIETAQNQFMASEQSVIECEKHIFNLPLLSENNCIIQSIDKNIWLISSQQKPLIQVHVYLNEHSGVVTRLNWRQAFE
jgi:hypothetical protein